ncbi:MAG TPA: phosphate ABC transporter substrate-binding protein PstS [Micromonospora sp.]
MKLRRHTVVTGLTLGALVALSACGSDNEPATSSLSAASVDCATGTLNAQGSSAQKNAMAEWIKEYQQRCPGVTINYEPSGSGAGIQAFIAGTADFAGSDSVLKPDERPRADATCGGNRAIHLPMVIGPVAVIYNVPGVTDLQLTPATLARIFAGEVTRWNDPVIAADNPNTPLPSLPIQAVHRSDESGTTDNFTAFLSAAAPREWTFGTSKAWKAPGGTGAKGSDGVTSAVKQTTGAIGYVEMSFAENSNLPMAKIANGAGEFVALTPESAGKAVADAAVSGQGNDLTLSVDYTTTASGAYPIVLVTYEIVCDKGIPADKLPLIKGFLGYAASPEGQARLVELGYAPLPETVRAKVAAAIDQLS